MPGLRYMSEETAQAFQATRFEEQRITLADMTTQATQPGVKSLLAEYQADVAHEILQDQPTDLHIVVHETFTDDGTANTETVSLGYDLVDAPAVPNDVVVWNDGTRVDPAAVDYAADTVDIGTNGNSETYDIYYVTGSQGQVTFRLSAPRNVYHEPQQADLGLLNTREQNRDPFEITARHPVGAVIPTDWTLQVYVKAPYNVEFTNSNRDATATNMVVSVPVNRAGRSIPGLGEAAKNYAREA